LIEQVARAKPSIFIMTGGDPRMRPDLEKLVDYAALLGLRVAISPSATPRWLKTDLGHLKDLGLSSISLSLDGASRKTHDAFRGVLGTWDRTMKAIEAAKEAGLYLQINTTITRGIIKELPGFFRVLEDIQPGMWSVFLLVPTGRAAFEDLPTAQEIEELFEQLADAAPHVPYAIKTTEGHHFRRVLLQKRVLSKGGHGLAGMQGIGDGKGFVFISHTGEIFPSGFLPLSCGNVRSQELIDIYRDSPVFRSLRNADALKGKCGRCEFRKICGGSRARAYAMTGDYLAEEPLCVYQPSAGAGRLPGFANVWNATA
jgi:radical SAM protein with 4Fe4S-binding SPASM domain